MITWLLEDIDTPAVLIDYDLLQNNIQKMASFAKKYNLRLRPHIKTHKIKEIAELQMNAGAVGITTAKLGEAEVMAELGFRDILIAYPIVGTTKLKRLHRLMKMANITTVIDGIEQAEGLNEYAKENHIEFPVLIEVDTGLRRCGVKPGTEVVELYRKTLSMPYIRVIGIMTHAGHAYGASTHEQVIEIAKQEGMEMVSTANLLQQSGYSVEEISVGSTPTVEISGTIHGVTEIRPGNYVFNDMTQVRLGVAASEDCSLRVVARIVGHPAPERFIIDAGAKTLALDQGAHGTQGVKGYGTVVGHPELTISRLSEEHGIVDISGISSLRVGDKIEIIPNHSCPVVNLTDEVVVIQKGKIRERWRVAARGRTR
ncbi:MAG TPA: alanine racemase [Bacillota bacterium]|nr:alanine racemase [Bacillota bacterium]